MAKLI